MKAKQTKTAQRNKKEIIKKEYCNECGNLTNVNSVLKYGFKGKKKMIKLCENCLI